jgi:hypothetical protein
MSLSQQQQMFCLDVSKLIAYINSQGYACTFGEAFRTAMQAEWYHQQGKGIKDSLHCQRLAIDLNLFGPDGSYLSDNSAHEPFGKYWETLSDRNRWGGEFQRADGNHYERMPV